MKQITHHHVGDASVDHLQIHAVDEPGSGGAYHEYLVSSNQLEPASVTRGEGEAISVELQTLGEVHFQNGPIKETGVNGLTQEALIAICMHRLECFQDGPFPSEDNAEALEHLAKAMECLQRRTKDRLARNVEGTLQA